MEFYKGLVIGILLTAAFSSAMVLTLGVKALLAIYLITGGLGVSWFWHTDGLKNIPEMEG